MTTREWATKDKSAWGRGEWQDEPDKIQWVDEATNLDCLMVRNHIGAWCGYVGVPESHPWFGVGYSDCPQHCSEDWCGHRPDARIDVHGGLTFSDFCQDATPETWERWRARMAERKADLQKYPKGDSARAWREMGHLVDDYAGWCKRMEATSICHVPFEGRPHKVWWLGFDCSHSGDSSPAYAEHGLSFGDGNDTYKSRGYAETQVRALAAQLKAVA